MLNVKATPCKKSKALVLVGKRYTKLNDNFIDKLEKTTTNFLGMTFEIFGNAADLQNASCFSIFRKRNPKRWYRFLKFCKKDGRIKVYRKNNKMVYEVPTCFEE